MPSVLVYTTETAIAPAVDASELDRVYVVCRTCGYERELGIGCGFPCV